MSSTRTVVTKQNYLSTKRNLLKLNNNSKKGKGTAHPPNTPSTSTDNQGLVPLVTPRPPATSLNNTPPQRSIDDSFQITEEEANLLDPLFSLTTPSATPRESADSMETEAIQVSDKLLSFRKQYKKTTVALAKAEAHTSFVSSCLNQQHTPKGLKVKVQCSAFLADLTSVRDQFKDTTKSAEQGYLLHLNDHYSTVVEELSQKRSVIRSAMSSLEEQADPEEKETHRVLLQKTDSNVLRLSTDLARRKKRKLDDLTNPPQKRKKIGEPPKRAKQMNRFKSSEEARPQQPTRPQSVMVSHPNKPLPSLPPQNNQNMLNMTLGDLLTGITQNTLPSFQLQPHIVPAPCIQPSQPPRLAFCAPVVGQPPQLVQPGVRGGLGQPPQLPRLLQQNCQPNIMGQPPQLSQQQQVFGRMGRLPLE